LKANATPQNGTRIGNPSKERRKEQGCRRAAESQRETVLASFPFLPSFDEIAHGASAFWRI
jgi:hypothetical protein